MSGFPGAGNIRASKEPVYASTGLPSARLALSSVPERCPLCGEAASEWPLSPYGNRLHLACPNCHVVIAAVVAAAQP